MSNFIVEKLSKSVGDKTVFKDISFIIHDLDRIGLIGVNGTGKTTLLDVVSGVSGFDGDVSPFSAKNDYQIGYLTQDPDFDDSKTVLDTVLSSELKEIQLIREYELLMLNYSEDKQARLERVMAEMDSLQAWEIESQVKTVLSKLGIQNLSTPVGELSGGLRRRVQLAQVLLGNHDLLLLDEPTNHLDMRSKDVLKEAIKNFDGTVIVVSHDREFLDGLVSKVYEFADGQVNEHLGGIYDYLRTRRMQTLTELERTTTIETKTTREAIPETEAKADYRRQKEVAKQLRTLERTVATCEERIGKLESELQAIEMLLQDPKHATDANLFERYAGMKQELEKAMEDWEQASEALSEAQG